LSRTPDHQIEIVSSRRLTPAERSVVDGCVRAALRAARSRGSARIEVAFVDCATARNLNRHFRGRRYTPNVLSFVGDRRIAPGEHARNWGEVVVAPTVAARETKRFRLREGERLAHLIIHGVLHLAGIDHERSRREAIRMEAIESRLLAQLTPRELRACAAVMRRYAEDP
jgi:probable rRNA maturation factor